MQTLLDILQKKIGERKKGKWRRWNMCLTDIVHESVASLFLTGLSLQEYNDTLHLLEDSLV